MDSYNFMLNIVKEAGEKSLSFYERGVDSQVKNNNPRDIVTEADYAINDFLINKIQTEFPEHSIYSEEGGGKITTNAPIWMIDPIDGTTLFARQIPHFSVAVGLVQNGVVLLGGVYNPVTREFFHFKKGEGVYRNNKKVKVSAVTELNKSFVLARTGKKESLWQWGADLYKKLLERANKTSNFGSSALDICFVASGKIEAAIYGQLNVKDISAAVGILREAGGFVVDKKGEDIEINLDSNEPQTVIFANNEKIKEALLKLV